LEQLSDINIALAHRITPHVTVSLRLGILARRETLDADGQGFTAGESRIVRFKRVGEPMELLPLTWT